MSDIDLFEAYKSFPADVRKKLSCYDLQRMQKAIDEPFQPDPEYVNGKPAYPEPPVPERRLMKWCNGALMCNVAIEGVTQDLMMASRSSIQFYGGRYFVCETILPSAGRQIAEGFGAQWAENGEF